MSRTDQPMGLSQKAQVFLEENEKKVSTKCGCPDCKTAHISTEVLKQCGTYSGMFDDEYILYRHELVTGKLVYEFLQASPWSSGPMMYLSLAWDKEGKHPVEDCNWTDKEVEGG